MSADFDESSDDKVGYGHPPRSTRFRKGVSGNPKGRPKGTLNVATVLLRTLRERVVLREGGKRKTVTKLEAAIKQLVNQAASGHFQALRQLLELARDAESTAPDQSREPVIGELDKDVIAGILKRFQQSAPEQQEKSEDHD